MSKSKQPRRRKTASQPEPVQQEEPVQQAEPQTQLVPRPAPPARTPAPPALSQLLDALRTVAGRMIDIADQAAEAITRRLGGRA